MGAGQTQGGWFREDNVLAQAKANGTLAYQSPDMTAPLSTINSVVSWLNSQAEINGQLGSAGYWLWGDNCVDGVGQVLARLNYNANVATYMQPSLLPVYAYAQAMNSQIVIPTPAGAVNVETNPYKVVVDYEAALLAYASQAGASVVQWFANLIGSASQDSNGAPQIIQAGQIVVTLQSPHVTTITYDSPIQVYDLQGNYVNSGSGFGLPSDLQSAMQSDLDSFQGLY